jgi:hypothetical protein
MDETTLEITLPNLDTALANKYTQELMAAIRASTPEVTVDRHNINPQNQDLGTIIGIIVGSAGLTAVAKGIADWLRKRQTANITIKRDGSIIAENVTSADAVKLLETRLMSK